VAALFVDFIHVQPAQSEGARVAALGVTVHASPSRTTPAGDDHHSCPACAWLRVGHRVETHISIGTGTQDPTARVGLFQTRRLESPLPRHIALRGPPPHTFS
jgi:hypothetical protein